MGLVSSSDWGVSGLKLRQLYNAPVIPAVEITVKQPTFALAPLSGRVVRHLLRSRPRASCNIITAMPAVEQGVAHSKDRYKLIPRVLCFVTHGDDVLLLKGAPTKRIWANRYNGLGGHVERGEGVYAAAAREIAEESGVPVRDLRLRGVVTINTGEADGIGLYVFTAAALTRETSASSEGALEWVPVARVAEYALVEDLFTLIPRLFSRPPEAPAFSARYFYDEHDRWVMEFEDGEGRVTDQRMR
jgi:8-oxo-dGTP diphosphatase